MGKSTRSKVKRHFRAKKREEGVYAATEAARLHRLNMKLKGIASADKEGDVELEDAETDGTVNAVDGSYLYFFLGILDHEDVTPEVMEAFAKARPALHRPL